MCERNNPIDEEEWFIRKDKKVWVWAIQPTPIFSEALDRAQHVVSESYPDIQVLGLVHTDRRGRQVFLNDVSCTKLYQSSMEFKLVYKQTAPESPMTTSLRTISSASPTTPMSPLIPRSTSPLMPTRRITHSEEKESKSTDPVWVFNKQYENGELQDNKLIPIEKWSKWDLRNFDFDIMSTEYFTNMSQKEKTNDS